MARVSKSGLPIVADTKALRDLARDIRRASPEAWVACRTAMRASAQVIADDAKQRAGEFSTRIPDSVRTIVGPGSVKIRAGGESAANAAPIENKGRGHVRHPVFGNREVWTDKNSPPAFLAPALDAHREETAQAIAEAVFQATARVLRGRV